MSHSHWSIAPRSCIYGVSVHEDVTIDETSLLLLAVMRSIDLISWQSRSHTLLVTLLDCLDSRGGQELVPNRAFPVGFTRKAKVSAFCGGGIDRRHVVLLRRWLLGLCCDRISAIVALLCIQVPKTCIVLIKVLHGKVLCLLDYAVPLSIIVHHHRTTHELLVPCSRETHALPSSAIWSSALGPRWLR